MERPRRTTSGRFAARARRGAPAAVLLLLAAGCSQPNASFGRRNQVVALRDNVNQLESEKSRLERQVAELSAENRQLEDRLVREEAHSSELAERLDDARRVSRLEGSAAARDATAGRDRDDWDEPAPRRTTPANAPRGRRTPVAQIPGELDPLPDSGRDDFAPRSGSRTTPPEDEPRESDLFGPTSDLEASRSRATDRERWLPMARNVDATRR